MDETFVVGSMFDCTHGYRNDSHKHNSLWKQTLFGCNILQVLQDIFHFNMTYVVQKKVSNITAEIIVYNTKRVDFFARPMSLRADVMELAYPVHQLFDWEFGFTVFRQESYINYNYFYSQPFTRRLWNSLYGMVFFCSIFLYALKLVEVRLLKDITNRECSYWYEQLMVVGAYCQHIPPIDATLCSRRTAYFSIFIFAYVVHTYYTSNFLSHLVNDKEVLDAEALMNSDLNLLILEDDKSFIWNTISFQNRGNTSLLHQKVLTLKPVSLNEGLKAVKYNKTALMSDYVSLGSALRTEFENHEICHLKNIDVVKNLKKYFFVSNDFPYKEEFKIAFLKLKEFGIIDGLKRSYYANEPECIPVTEVSTQFQQIFRPMMTLIGAYVLCVIILGCEILHHRRTRLFPYVN